jgi:predicted nuclease of predicted toxin-antitoxin system
LRILADESVEGEVVARLRGEGHDVAYIPEASAGIRDDEVLVRANTEGRVLLTEDKDFNDRST